MKFELIEVECYSGYKSNEKPLSFKCKGRYYRISEVIDRWYEGNIDSKQSYMNYFKVRTEDGAEHIMRYNALFDSWSILIKESNNNV